MEPRRILILNLAPNTMGDSLFLTPVITALKRTFPRATVMITCSEPLKELFEGYPDLDRLLVIPGLFDIGKSLSKPRKLLTYIKLFWRTYRILHSERPDVVLITQPNFWPNQLIPWFARVPRRIGYTYRKARASWTLTDKVPYQDTFQKADRHYTDTVLDLAAPLGASIEPADANVLKIVAPEDKQRALRWLIQHHIKKPFICLQPGSKWPRKTWPANHWRELADKLNAKGYPVLLLGSPREHDWLAPILNGATDVHSAVGFDVNLVAALLQKSALAVTNDSGIAHLASAVGTKTVVIYGISSSYVHSRVRGQAPSTPVFATEKPPMKIYDKDTPETIAAMASITVDRVLIAVGQALK